MTTQPATARVEWQRQVVWAVPAALAAAVTGYLSWGAWVAAHHPALFYGSGNWLHAWLRPGDNGVLLVVIALWMATLLCYWWPRRLQPQVAGLIIIVAMVVVGAVLGVAALGQCRGQQSGTAVTAWVLQLYVGQEEPVYGTPAGMGCPGSYPLALQLARIICLAATFVGATAAASMLWRAPIGRLRSRMVRDATVLTGLDTLTLPLLQRLTETRKPASVVVIEPNGDHPLLDIARSTGARVMIADPTSRRALLPVLSGWRGCALSYLYAMQQDASGNEAVLDAARAILRRCRSDPERQPHLIARIDDPRHADHWRGLHGGTSSQWFEDALSPEESTARALVSQLLRTGAQQLLLCGDSTLALAVLLELAHHAWERRGLDRAAGATRSGDAFERVGLLDLRAEDLAREYRATAPRSIADALPGLEVQAAPWRDQLLATLDATPPHEAAATAVVVTDPLTEGSMHEAGRVARLHPATPVFVLSFDGAGISGAIFDQLQPFQRAFLVDGDPPEDAWTRIARHWHECYRLSRPAAAGNANEATRRPWPDLDEFIRQDNILQLRSILVLVAALGRRWVPVREVAPGSFIDLTDRELKEVAEAEHTRWFERRWDAGWRAGPGQGSGGSLLKGARVNRIRVNRIRVNGTSPDGAKVNSAVVPWAEFPADRQQQNAELVQSQLAQLEDVGFMPVIPKGGPPHAADYLRTGAVRARRLTARRPWATRAGDKLRGEAGDWRVIDAGGDERTVRDQEFRASHARLADGGWARTGIFRAWQVTETVRVRTLEGRSTAQPQDWIVESPGGARWTVANDQFRSSYRPAR